MTTRTTRTTKLAHSVRHAAELVDVHPDTLRNEWKAGRIVFVEIGGRYRIFDEELVRWRNALPVAVPKRSA